MNLGLSFNNKNTPYLGYFIQDEVNRFAEKKAIEALKSGEITEFAQILPQVQIANTIAEAMHSNRAEWDKFISKSFSGTNSKTGKAINYENNLAKSQSKK